VTGQTERIQSLRKAENQALELSVLNTVWFAYRMRVADSETVRGSHRAACDGARSSKVDNSTAPADTVLNLTTSLSVRCVTLSQRFGLGRGLSAISALLKPYVEPLWAERWGIELNPARATPS